ncbi:hypothetical protein C8Q80DRAFT_638444 [Daedaleopsis nitida]|nr:hypothetical protein C8Q80DRAFT_638444 [Daedaleopsis nitida]
MGAHSGEVHWEGSATMRSERSMRSDDTKGKPGFTHTRRAASGTQRCRRKRLQMGTYVCSGASAESLTVVISQRASPTESAIGQDVPHTRRARKLSLLVRPRRSQCQPSHSLQVESL